MATDAIGTLHPRQAVFFVAALLALPGSPLMAADGIIENGAVWRDTSGKEIWCNGGHMIRRGDTFYWVGYETAPRRPWHIKLYSSKNLADWKFESNLIGQQGAFATFGWAGRPAMLHHRKTGRYVILFEADSPKWRRHKVGFARCDRIDGKYELAACVHPEGTRTTGDQSVYQEGGKGYLVCTMDHDAGGRKYLNTSLAIFRLTDDFLGIKEKVYEGFEGRTGPAAERRHQSSREASHIIKVNGTYYWLSSGLQGWNSTQTKYATAKSLAGPWSRLKTLPTDPRSGDSYNTQHDFVIPVVGSQVTTWLYVGDRYSQWTRRGRGRNIFLPLTWKDGSPTLKWCPRWKIDVATGTYEELPHKQAAP
ncbi:MAG: hypothetical protein AMK72_02425 [Planctomycetes bacterium SM23_25]|nr:MAG: hypothetical protein AMK72_02425 [Planctomycetes bacterium SM23_25]